MDGFNVKRPINKRMLAYVTGGSISMVIITVLVLPSNSDLHAHGPMNIGHEKVQCSGCHKMATGTLRQQLQAYTKYFLGLRERPVTVGYSQVSNDACVYCHDRPSDTHPVYRFMEPRFSKVRAKLQAQTCIFCHKEHTARRITIDRIFCRYCHEKLSIKNDTLSTSHAKLVIRKDWKTCLGCHDYHGNHRRKVTTDLSKIIADTEVKKYFDGTLSLYGNDKKHKVRKTL
ncbi:MAG: cytochrome c3 family protein [Thiohalomonadales bacterium]